MTVGDCDGIGIQVKSLDLGSVDFNFLIYSTGDVLSTSSVTNMTSNDDPIDLYRELNNSTDFSGSAVFSEITAIQLTITPQDSDQDLVLEFVACAYQEGGTYVNLAGTPPPQSKETEKPSP